MIKAVSIILGATQILLIAAYSSYLLWFIEAPFGLWVLMILNFILGSVMALVKELLKEDK